MALVTYPLNDIDFTAEDAELFHCTRSSGVHTSNSFQYSVTGANNVVTIGTGIAWIHNTDFSGKVAALKASLSVNLGVPDSTYPRIDAIVLQFSANNNETKVVVKKGTAASSPAAPSVTRTASVYELHLYHVRREAGATAITAADITDLRFSSNYCGMMADSVTKVDTSAIEAQVKSLMDRLEAEIESRLESIDNAMNNSAQTGVPVPTLAQAGLFPRVTADGTSYELVDLLNLHVWKKYANEPIYIATEVDSTLIASYLLGAYTITYAQEISVTDDEVSLVDEQKIEVTGATDSNLNNIKGKFVRASVSNIYLIHPNATFTIKTTGTGGTGTSASIYVNGASKITAGIPDPIGFAASADSSVYPTSGEHTDGYWYEYHKRLGE